MEAKHSTAHRMPVSLLSSALEYTESGLSVIPVRPLDKKPFIPWAEFQKRRATAEEIRVWWVKWPKAMIGICTGEVSGVFVVDCDTPEGFEAVQKLIPETLLMPTARTPRGGWHLYFRWLQDYKLTIGAGVLPGVDFRSDGGLIIAPPSINADGKAYAWQEGLALGEAEPPSMPSGLLAAINKESTLYRGERYTCNADTAKFFTEGRRDNDLFHIANCLTKGGMPAGEISQVLENLIISWGEKPDAKWISDKVESAKKRDSRRSGDVTKAIEEWVSVTDGYFSVTDCARALQGVTDSGQTTFRGILHRLSKRGIIEKHGQKDGVYRRLDNEIEPLDWRNADTNPLNLRWPFGIENLVSLYPGNLAVIAGAPNAGKTSFILNFIHLNQEAHNVHLFSSEGGKEELRMRIEKFGFPLDLWTFSAFERSGDFADIIKPDDINIIDYLEIHEEFYKIGGILKGISDRLRKGFCLIALQKNTDRDEGLGGARGLEKPRLYLAMDGGRLKIVKAKSWVDSAKNPNGQAVRFKLVDGCKFIIESRWERESK
jgi:hypothetical protein